MTRTGERPSGPVPVHLLTGFLGSGKTTLLNRLLSDPEFSDTAVIVNEFGEIGLDHLLVRGGPAGILLLDSGCLCCLAGDSLADTLLDLWSQRERKAIPLFRRVVIETSGLAEPAPIAAILMKNRLVSGRYGLGRVLVTVDSVFGAETLDRHHEASEQLALADLVILTKTDRAEAREAEVREAITERNPIAPVVTTEDRDFDFTTWLDLRDERLGSPSLPQVPHHHPEGAAGQRSWTIERPVTWSGIAAFTSVAAGLDGVELLRCKAILNVQGERSPILLQGVRDIFETERLDAWPTADRRSRLTCIFRGPEAPVGRLVDLLHAEMGTLPPTSLPS